MKSKFERVTTMYAEVISAIDQQDSWDWAQPQLGKLKKLKDDVDAAKSASTFWLNWSLQECPAWAASNRKRYQAQEMLHEFKTMEKIDAAIDKLVEKLTKLQNMHLASMG